MPATHTTRPEATMPTTTSHTWTNADTFAGDAIAAAIDAAHSLGHTVLVDGREVWSKHRGNVVHTYLNGSVEVLVRGRQRSTQGTVWVKRGQAVTVTVTPAAAR